MLFLGETKSPGAYLIKALFYLCIRNETVRITEKNDTSYNQKYFSTNVYMEMFYLCANFLYLQ